MVTIKEVAHLAGVAPGTVSNVLTGKRPVAAATRERVLQAVAELGYQPNVLARSLVNRRSETIAAVATGLNHYGPSTMVVGIQQQAHELGYSVLLHLLDWSEEDKVPALLRGLRARHVDGIIWAVPEVGCNRDWITSAALAELPPVVFLAMDPRPDVTVSNADNWGGGMQAVGHLAEQGRRRIGFIAGQQTWWPARVRLAGYRAGKEAAGLNVDSKLEFEGDWSAESGDVGLRALLEREPKLDAVCVSSDVMALGVLQAAHRAGRAIPDDLAVVGFDNQPQSAFFWPPLTSVDQHLAGVGRVGVELLHQMIDCRQAGLPLEPQVRVQKSTLVVRESSGHYGALPRQSWGAGDTDP